MDHCIHQTEPASLAPLLDLPTQAGNFWKDEELSDILRHQLRAPLLFDLKTVDRRAEGPAPTHPSDVTDEVIAGDTGAPLANFVDLLRHPRPPLDLLKLTKEFAKSSDSRSDSPLPPEVATVLYYASIVAALVHRGLRITSLTDEQLEGGLAWAVRQPWLDESTRGLFLQGQRQLALKADARAVDIG